MSTKTYEEVAAVMERLFAKAMGLRKAGQQEYARKSGNAFANFERVGERLSLDRKKVLMVYLEKHLDGIHAFIEGHKSQREGVEGRILDAIVYLCLLAAMVQDEETPTDLADEYGKGIGV